LRPDRSSSKGPHRANILLRIYRGETIQSTRLTRLLQLQID
jgi:hypothetical protein